MSDIRELLAGIEKRADEETGRKADAEFVAAARTDVPRLVAALRAVLDYADSIDHPEHYENTEREEVCRKCHERNPWRGGAYWPCSHRKHAESIRNAITDALGGGA